MNTWFTIPTARRFSVCWCCVALLLSSVAVGLRSSRAQDIGHLGAQDVPLVQLKRVRKYIARNSSRKNDHLIAEVGGLANNSKAKLNNNANGTMNNPPAGTKAQSTSVSQRVSGQSGSALSANASSQPINNKPTLTPYQEALAKADAAAGAGNHRQAAQQYQQALSLQPNAAEARLGYADALHDAKDYAGAAAAYQLLLAQQDPANQSIALEARRSYADVLYDQRRYDEAIAEYEAAQRAGLRDAGFYNNYANALYRSGKRVNRDRALQQYRLAIQQDPQSSDAHAGLANALRTNRQLNEAQQLAERAVKLNGNSAVAHSILGRVYADARDFARANAAGEKAVQLAPADAFMHLNLGGIYYLQNRRDDAQRAYLRAIAADPQWAQPHNSLGNLLMANNRPQEALEQFAQATQLEPRNATILNNYGSALAKLSRWPEAVQKFQLATQADAFNPAPFANLGRSYAELREFDLAIKAMQQAVALEPGNSAFLNGLLQCYRLAGRKNEAKATEERLAKLGVNPGAAAATPEKMHKGKTDKTDDVEAEAGKGKGKNKKKKGSDLPQ